MSARQKGSCGEAGPRTAHCTERRMHDYSCYDGGEDVSWNEGQWYDFDLAPHQCDDPDCPYQGYRGPEGRESEYGHDEDDENSTGALVDSDRVGLVDDDGVTAWYAVRPPICEADPDVWGDQG